MKSLIISDNAYISKEIEKVLEKKDLISNFDFAISKFSDLNVFESLLNSVVIQIDIKCELFIRDIVEKYSLVFSVHCKQIFPESLINQVKCINLHPGLNPWNRGWYPQVFAIINKNIIGATLHEIDKELDNGPIIDRKETRILPWDTSLDLYNRVVKIEIELFDKNIQSILDNTYLSKHPEFAGHVYLKQDFRELCELNLDSIGTLGEHLDLLRALTHGDFKNAFFYDKTSGKKVFLSLSLYPENVI